MVRTGRWSYWREGVFEGGYYDLYEHDRWVGWTNSTIDAVNYVFSGDTKALSTVSALRADLILDDLIGA
jgi:hypothetical protein